METDGLKILLAVEPRWTASLNGREFLPLESSQIAIDGSTIRFGPYTRRITACEWLRPDVVRMTATSKFRSHSDTITFYPGTRLPGRMDLLRRRRTFQIEIGKALCAFFGVGRIQRQKLHTDWRYGIGAAYPRFLIGPFAAITVDPDESSAVINGLMRAALLWQPQVRRHLAAVVPRGRHHCLAARLRVMSKAQNDIHWLQWDGANVRPLEDDGEQPETHVPAFAQYIARRAARPDAPSSAHNEQLLESKIIGEICRILPSIDAQHVYPQVPGFFGEDRNLIDLLTITRDGRLVVIEIKASPDPELPFQALDYWIAVERHRASGDFARNGYFPGRVVRDEPALLLMVAPLLGFHKTSRQLIAALPQGIPLMEIGLNQTWIEGIKVLRRKGMLS